MPKTIDQRIVQMQFDNAEFQSKSQKTLERLKELKESLKFDNAAKGIDALSTSMKKLESNSSNISNQVDGMASRLNAFGIASATVISNATNLLLRMSAAIADNVLGISDMIGGFQEYETQINATQTILANTKRYGKTIDDVNKALDDLNEYADKTIYNFTEMTRNIGLFTTAGIDLEVARDSIKGLANVAALAGANSEAASRAMYQMSQGLSAGYIKLQDWMSIENAGMASSAFQDAIKETARVHGVAIDDIIKQYGSFRASLSEPQWLTTDILTETLQIMTGDITDAQMKQMGYTDAQIKSLQALAQEAVESATVIRTWSQLMQNMAEVIGSGWATSFRIIFGNYEQAKETFTRLSEYMSVYSQSVADARNQLLQSWADLGGREAMFQGIFNMFEALAKIVSTVKKAWSNIFPKASAEGLVNITKGFENFTEKLILTEDASKALESVLTLLFAVFKAGIDAISGIADVMFSFISGFTGITGAIGGVASSFAESVSSVNDSGEELFSFSEILQSFSEGISKAFDVLSINVTFSLESIADGIASFLKDTSIQDIIAIVGSGSLLMLVLKLTDFVDGISDITDVAESIKWSISASAFKSLATGIALIAGSLVAISLINKDDLIKGLSAFGALLLEVSAGILVMNKATSSIKLSEIAKLSAVLLAFSTSLVVFTTSIAILSTISWEGLSKGLVALAILLVELSVATKTMSQSGPGLLITATSLAILSTAITGLSVSLKLLSTIDYAKLAAGLAAFQVIIADLIVVSKFMSSAKGLISASASMILMATAINALSVAITVIGHQSLETIGKGLLAISGAMTILVTSLNLVSKNLLGAVAISTIAVALTALVPPILALGSLDIKTIATALGTMAATIATFGVAAKVLTPVIPSMLALSAAILAIGAGVLATTTGLALLSATLVGLATSVGVVVAGIGAAITAVVVGLPKLIESFISTFLSIADTFVDKSGEIVSSVVDVFGAIADAIAANLPKLVTAGIKIVRSLVDGLVEAAPFLVTKAVELVVTLAKAIANNLEPIVDAAFELIINFIEALAKALGEHSPRLIKALFSLGLELVKSLGEALAMGISFIVKGAIELGTAFTDGLTEYLSFDKLREIAEHVISGFVNGIQAGIGAIADAARNLASKFINTTEEELEVHSPSVAMFTIGGYVIQGFVNGIQNGIPKVEESARNIGRAILEPISDVSSAYTQLDKILSDGLDSYDHFWQEYAEELEELKLGNRELKKHSNSLKDFKTQVANAQEEANKLAEANSNFFDITQVASDAILAFGERYGEVLGTLDAHATLEAAKAGFMEMTVQAADSAGKFDELKDKYAQVAEKEAEIAEKAKEAKMTVEEFKTTMSESELAALNMSDSLGFLRDAYNELKAGISDTIESQMSLFTEFERKTDLSSDQLLFNMRTQINAISDWSRNLQDLAARGIDEGLLKKLAEMGPQGYEYVNAFTNMTTSQLEQANELYGKAMKLPDKISNEIMASYAYAGLMATNGFAQGLMKEPGVEKAVEMAKASSTALNAALEIHSPSEVTKASGQYFAQGFAQGIANNVTMVTNAVSGLIRNAVSSLQGHEEEFKMAGDSLVQSFATAIETSASIGTSFVESFTSAFSSNSAAVTGSMLTLATNMLDSLSKGLTSNTGLVEKAAKSINDAVTRGFGDSSAEMITKGRNVSESYADGITKAATSAINAVRSLGSKVHAEINTFKTSYESSGEGLIEAIVKGFNSMENRLVNAAGNLTSESLSEVESYYSWFMDAGESLVRGFASGITAYTFYAEARAAAMARAAYNAAMEELDAHSPSRLMEKVGGYFAKGFSNGIENDASISEDSAARMAQTAMDATMTVLDRITALLNGSLDMTPTITPVLDLSQIEKDARRLDTMMNNQMANKTSQMFNASSQNGSNSLENGVNSSNTGGGDIIFNQYNTSPKALSRIDIYRQTKTQLSQAKGLI